MTRWIGSNGKRTGRRTGSYGFPRETDGAGRHPSLPRGTPLAHSEHGFARFETAEVSREFPQETPNDRLAEAM